MLPPFFFARQAQDDLEGLTVNLHIRPNGTRLGARGFVILSQSGAAKRAGTEWRQI